MHCCNKMSCFERQTCRFFFVFINLAVGILPTTISATNGENVTLVILKHRQDFQGILKLRHENGSETTLKAQVDLFHKNEIVLATEAKVNAISWLSATDTIETSIPSGSRNSQSQPPRYPIVECLWNSRNTTKVEIPELLQLTTTSLRNFYFQIDPFGNSLYWKHDSSNAILATSLVSKPTESIELLRYNSKVGASTRYFFAIDTFQGYIFLHALVHPIGSGAYRTAGVVRLRRYQTDSVVLPVGHSCASIALDYQNQTVYYLCNGKIISKSYEEALRSSPVYSDSEEVWSSNDNFYMDSLQYFEDFWYFRMGMGNQSIFRTPATVDLKKAEQVLNGAQAFNFSVYEDRFPERISNPCVALNCSDFCLPEIVLNKNQSGDTATYACRCPKGQFLKKNNKCIPVNIVYKIQNETFVSPYVDGGHSVSTKCQEYKKNSAASLEAKACQLIQNHNGSDIQIDAYGESWAVVEDNCVKFSSSNTNISVPLHYCVPSSEILGSFAIDFQRGILFYIQSGYDASNRKTCYLKNHFWLPGSTVRVPPLSINITCPASALTLNPSESKIHWIQDKLLMETDYNNNGTVSRNYSLDLNTTLRFAFDRLWWNVLENGFAISTGLRFSGDDGVKHVIQSTYASSQLKNYRYTSIQNFYVVKSSRTFSPCKNATCLYACFPRSGSPICLCPDDSIPSSSREEPCSAITILVPTMSKGSVVLETRSLSSSLVSTALPVFQIETSTVPKLIAASYSSETVCWISNGSNPVACHQKGKTVNILHIPQTSTMLVLSRDGRELFWNSGEAGRMFVTLLRQNLTFNFTEFETPGIVSFALDIEQKFFFWGDNQSSIHTEILSSSYNSRERMSSDFQSSAGPLWSIAVDTKKQVLYFTQGYVLNRITYQALFNNQKEAAEAVFVFENLVYASVKNWQVFNDFLVGIASPITYTDRYRFLVFSNRIRKLFIGKPVEMYSDFQVYGVEISKPVWNNPCDSKLCSEFCFPKLTLEGSTNEHPDYICRCASDSSQTSFWNSRYCANDPLEVLELYIPYLIAGIVFVATCSISCFIAAKYRKRRNPVPTEVSLEPNVNHDYENVPNESTGSQNVPRAYMIARSQVKVDKEKRLGEGQFGQVFQGTYRKLPIAVKTIKHLEDEKQVHEFLQEIQILARIGSHPNIVKFYGAVTEGKPIMVVFELSPFGSLLNVIRANCGIPSIQNAVCPSPGSPETSLNILRNGISLQQLLSWSEQIAHGMLHLQTAKIIHGDLAARNILVFDNAVIKLSDFGLSRSLYYDAIYVKKNLGPLPWRWMALESIQLFQFSPKSDVWAYGVTLWEIFSFGLVPYVQYSWGDKFNNALSNGVRLRKPKSGPIQIYELIMLQSWKLDPAKRPDFYEILYRLTEIRSQLQFPVDQQPCFSQNVSVV